MAQTADIAEKILPYDVVRVPARFSAMIPANCTKEEIKMLVLARLGSLLEKHGASYFTVDGFVATLDLLLAPDYPSRDRPPLIYELEQEGRIAIVDFSPADIYRIVDKPSPNPQTRS